MSVTKKLKMFMEPLTTRPGEFRARCNLAKPHRILDMAQYERREAEEAGWPKRTGRFWIKGEWRAGEAYMEPLCDGFETTDRKDFEQHMREVHGKRAMSGENASLVRAASGKWRTPKAKPEGTPFKASTKSMADSVETCPTCGLVAEVCVGEFGRNADELWWREHVERCTGADPGCEVHSIQRCTICTRALAETHDDLGDPDYREEHTA